MVRFFKVYTVGEEEAESGNLESEFSLGCNGSEDDGLELDDLMKGFDPKVNPSDQLLLHLMTGEPISDD